MTSTPDERLDQLASQIDRWIRPYVEVSGGPASAFYSMMAYHLGWASREGRTLDRPAGTGKRLRPILAILTCEALGGAQEAARGPAVAVELIHNFSLVHDDIQDNSDYRRGRETVWSVWGAPQAINVGDAMFALAQVALVEGMAGQHRLGDAVLRLNRSCLSLVEGQFLDLHLESASGVTLGAYEEMIGRKTAALIECSCALGAMAAGADDGTVAACAELGYEVGIAFQFQDDVLGVWGDPVVTGKPIGADLRSRKKALPLVLALERTAGDAPHALGPVVSGHSPLDDGQVREILAIMDDLRIRQQAEEMVTARLARVERAIRAAVGAGRDRELLALCSRLRTRVT